jgi:hypothetical protein
MIVFMLNNSCRKAFENFLMLFKVFIIISDMNNRIPVYIFSDSRDTQTTFIKDPFFTFLFSDYGINENLFEIFSFFVIIKRCSISDK